MTKILKISEHEIPLPVVSRVVINETGIQAINTDFPNEIEEYLSLYYSFKYNVVTGKVLFQGTSNIGYSEVNDYVLNTIIRELKREDIKCTKTQLIGLLISEFTPKYDPFLQYLDGLPVWDGITDHISECADTVTTTNPVLWRKCFKKWILALVGSIKVPTTVNDTALIFNGSQGIGKTRWIGKLVPSALKEYFFSGTINMSNKDSVTQLSECMIIDMDELENLGKKSIGDLKSLMTRETIRIRRPYGRMAETLPRRASFIGSINHKEFLKDETGSRRFLCFEVTGINYTHQLDVDKLYAQALALYNSGFQYWFDADEIAEVQRNNDQFQKSFLEEELLWNHFEPCPENQATHLLPATNIAQILRNREKMSVSYSSVQRIGKALAARKFLRLKRAGRYVWAVKDKRASSRVARSSRA